MSVYTVQKQKLLIFCFVSGINRFKALHLNTTTPDPMQHATPHSSSPQHRPMSPLPSMSLGQAKTNRTYLGRVEKKTFSRQSERPCKGA